ncbi:MAG: T9SS type A sorting domain-containing protein [Saprospiraceae bacterium]|nr:T9SS type A sorting domain-containing protein [Saprospiraceae bacterium]
MKAKLNSLNRSFLLLLIALLVCSNLYSQYDICFTTPGNGSIGIVPGGLENISNVDGPYYIRIYTHIVRTSNGTGGQTIQGVEEAINILQQDFSSHNIFFVWDCNINYIDEDLHYFQDICNQFYPGYIFLSNPHTDGIDIYFFDENQNQNCGRAANIPSAAFYISGIYPGDPSISLSRSHVISHEMAHCLGLFHTHHGTFPEGGNDNPCSELVNGSNCSICGDYVCDTPADPNQHFEVLFPICEWQEVIMDINNHPYNPDEKNIMSYTHPKCMDYFTSEQGLRMRQMISFSSVLQDCLIDPDFVGHTITGNTTWTTANTPNNGNFLIGGDLVIEGGATLTINAGVTVHFGEQSRLIIKPNARLTLYGALTGMGCRGYTWQGVKVWGSAPSQSQYAVGGVKAQGSIDCMSGSLIENAKVGIQLYGPTYTLAGGQISCIGATIKNCPIGVEFAPYQNFWPFSLPTGQQGQPRNYVGSFTSISFLTNDDYPHSQPFHSFVHMTGVNGIRLSGCSYINIRAIQGSSLADWGYGIFANDAGFSVTSQCSGNPVPYPGPCESYIHSGFKGLGYGVYTARIVTNRPYTVRQANFEKCFVGIRNKSVTGSTLLFNNFTLGQLPSTDPTGDQVGVIFETDVAGFTCEENEFIGVSGNAETTIGTICINTGIANKTIRRNNFHGLTFGNLSNQQNASQLPQDGIRGLYYDCNRNFDVDDKDFSVPNGSIKERQGLEFDNQGQIIYNAAGNRFSYTGIDFSNLGAPIQYFYNPFGQNEEPLAIEGDVFKIPADTNTCPVTYCEPPCRTEEEIALVKSDFYQQKDLFLAAKASYAANPTDESARQMAYRQRMMDEDAYMVVIHELYDTIGFSADTLRTWLAHLGSLEGDLWLAGERLGSGNVQAALSLLNSAIGKYQLAGEGQADIGNYQAILGLLDGKPFYGLDAATLQSVRGYLDADGYAEGWAKSILTLYGGHFPAEYIKDGGSIEERSMEVGGSPDMAHQPEWVRASPNPARDLVNFSVSLPEGVKEAALRIFDVNGRQVHAQSGLAQAGSYIWQTGAHPSGVYFYHLTADGKVLRSGKIILNK